MAPAIQVWADGFDIYPSRMAIGNNYLFSLGDVNMVAQKDEAGNVHIARLATPEEPKDS